MQQKKHKGARVPRAMSVAEYSELCESSGGICTACGELAWGDTEPDAEGYECAACGEHAVRGIENALLLGDIAIGDDDDGAS